MTDETPPETETEESPPRAALGERILEALQAVLREDNDSSGIPMYAVTNFWVSFEYVAADDGCTVLQHVYDTDKPWYSHYGMLESARMAAKEARYVDFLDEEDDDGLHG